MLTFRTMVVLSAVAAAGIVTLTGPSRSEQTVGIESVKLQDRHPAFSVGAELRDALAAERAAIRPAPVSTGKSDRLRSDDAACAGYTWPNLPASCLQHADGSPARKPARSVSLEQRLDRATTVVTLSPASSVPH